MNANDDKTGKPASASDAMIRGSLGFALVSVIGFALWAFAGKWFYKNVGEAGLYFASAVLFVGSSGLLLHPLVQGSNSLARFYKIFMPAFLAYALVWCLAWFALRFGAGEWLGSLLGSLVFTALIGFGLRNLRGFLKVVCAMFALHSAGYFLGGKLMYWLVSPEGKQLLPALSKAQVSVVAKLSWGVLYGLGFGGGLGYAFWVFQRPNQASSAQLGT